MKMYDRIRVNDPESPAHGCAGTFLFGDESEDLAGVWLDGEEHEIAVPYSSLKPEPTPEPDPEVIAVPLSNQLDQEQQATLIRTLFFFDPGVRERVEAE